MFCCRADSCKQKSLPAQRTENPRINLVRAFSFHSPAAFSRLLASRPVTSLGLMSRSTVGISSVERPLRFRDAVSDCWQLSIATAGWLYTLRYVVGNSTGGGFPLVRKYERWRFVLTGLYDENGSVLFMCWCTRAHPEAKLHSPSSPRTTWKTPPAHGNCRCRLNAMPYTAVVREMYALLARARDIYR